MTLALDPINPSDPFASVALPLWLLFFVGIVAGVIAGWVGCWFTQGKHRKRAREAQSEVARLQVERERLLKTAEPEPTTTIVPMGTGWI